MTTWPAIQNAHYSVKFVWNIPKRNFHSFDAQFPCIKIITHFISYGYTIPLKLFFWKKKKMRGRGKSSHLYLPWKWQGSKNQSGHLWSFMVLLNRQPWMVAGGSHPDLPALLDCSVCLWRHCAAIWQSSADYASIFSLVWRHECHQDDCLLQQLCHYFTSQSLTSKYIPWEGQCHCQGFNM